MIVKQKNQVVPCASKTTHQYYHTRMDLSGHGAHRVYLVRQVENKCNEV